MITRTGLVEFDLKMKEEHKNYWGMPEYIREVKPYDMLDEDYLTLLWDKSNGLTNKNVLTYEELAWLRWYMSNPSRKIS